MNRSPTFAGLVRELGQVGLLLREIDGAEGRAGNISLHLSEDDVSGLASDPEAEEKDLPGTYPLLGNRFFLITGTGKRLWQIRDDPSGGFCIVKLNEDGCRYRILFGGERGVRPTSEFNSHLGIYQAREESGAPVRVIIHAQPLHLTALSHVKEFEDQDAFNRALFRWQPETIVMLPEGVGLIPYRVPGSAAQEAATAESIRSHRLLVWARHGVISVGENLMEAFDWIDYAEMVARYFYLNEASGLEASGFSLDQLEGICRQFKIESPLLRNWREKETKSSSPS